MNRLPSIRRWGVAALTGVTLFGGLSIIGAGVASAATTPTVTAAVTATATTVAGTGTAQAGAPITLTVNGTTLPGDKIVLTLACPTTGTASFSAITNSDTPDLNASAVVTAQSGTTCSTATFTVVTGQTNPVLNLSAITYTTSGVSSQALSISGVYETLGLPSTSFTVATDANVVWYSINANTPTVTLGASATTAVSSIAITDPAAIPAGDQLAVGDTITLTLPGGDTWAGTPTVSGVGATATIGTATNVLTLTVTAAPTTGNSALLTINGASVTTTGGSPLGAQNVAVELNPATTPTTPLVATAMFTGVSVGNILGNVTTIYGPDGTADGTVAAEFENAYPASTGGNANVVLATDAPSANGSDALAASYLEGTLGTGLLITSPTALGTDAQDAIRIEGVSTVYVVGGPLAISPAVLAQIQALPVYHAGGLTTTGATVKVVGPIAGADGTAAGTAAAIATRFGTAYGSGSFSGAYSSTGGLYNDTTGSATATGSGSPVPTAIVVAGTDWQDAMSIAPEAFKSRFPVILNGPSTDTSLDADASGALTSLGVKQVIIIGGQLALQNSVETQIAALNGGISVLRIAGIDATDTAAQIANFAFAAGSAGLGWTAVGAQHAVLASHVDYWTDALGAAALGGGANATFGSEPIIEVENPTTIGSYTTTELSTLAGDGISNLTVLGGPLAMPSSTVSTLLAGL